MDTAVDYSCSIGNKFIEASLRGSPSPSPRQKIDFSEKKIDFEISTCTESSKCPLSDYVQFIAL
jgi:hypothetical protein